MGKQLDERLHKGRVQALRERMSDHGVAAALISDEDSIYYFSGYHSYLYMDFGRPTFFVLTVDGDAAIITPAMEIDMARRMGWVDDIRPSEALRRTSPLEDWAAGLPGSFPN